MIFKFTKALIDCRGFDLFTAVRETANPLSHFDLLLGPQDGQQLFMMRERIEQTQSEELPRIADNLIYPATR